MEEELIHSNDILTLKNLGLTNNQAKVYLSLQLSKFSSVSQIQKNSKVPRQEIYKNLSKLEDMGFVEKTITRPVKFKAISIHQGVSYLLEQKMQEYKKIQNMAEELKKNYSIMKNNNQIQEINPHFILLPRNKASITKRREEIDKAQTCIDFITSWKRFPKTLYTFEENGLRAIKRNVKMRVILELPKDLKDIPEQINEFKKFPNYQIKYIIDQPTAIIGIFDKKTAIVKTSASVGLAEAPSLWTDNPCLISIISAFFELNWITAMESIPKTHELQDSF